MKHRVNRLWIAAGIGCLWALPAAAQQSGDAVGQAYRDAAARNPELAYTSEIEAGAGYVTTDSFKFGEYTGLEEQEPFAIGNVTVRRRDAFDSGSTQYYEGLGTNLGLESRSIHLGYGHQGTFDLFFDYDQTPHFQLDDARTPYDGSGSGTLTLPSGQNSGTTTSTITGLQQNLRDVEIETERKEFGGGFTWHISPQWSFKGEYQKELKDGTDTIAALFGETGGNPLAAIVAEPIDYEEDRANFSVEYGGERLQAALNYSGSWFSNDESSLTFDSPFTNAGWDDPNPDRGRMALPPDNQAHRVSLSAGYNLGDATRLAGLVSYGRMTQDKDFLPYTINPDLNVLTPLPRNSLDGEINNILVDVSARTRPLDKLDVGVRYQYDDRDNETPQSVYLIPRNDVGNQPLTLADAEARINLPYSTEKHEVNLDASYRVLPRTKVSVGYDFELKDRTFAVVETTRDHTFSTKVQSSPLDFLTGWVSYAHTVRDASTYRGETPFLDSHTPEYLATVAPQNQFENQPDVRKYYLTDRDSGRVAASLSIMPHEQVGIGLYGSYTDHNYYDGRFGLRDHTLSDVTLDVSYSPMSNLTAYAFFTHERQNMEQDGIQFVGFGAPLSVQFNDPERLWSMKIRDRVNTAGARVEWSAIADVLDVGAEYSFSKSISTFEPSGGNNTNTVVSLPDVTSRLHSLGLKADYHLQDNMSVRLAYWLQSFQSKDFALDGVGVSTVNQVLALGEGSPDYVAHVFGVSFAYKF